MRDTFLETAGKLLQRRPLEEEQLPQLVEIANGAAATTEDFYSGLALALEAVLISPEFVFIADRAEPDPNNPGKIRLDSYSLASRLSFFLWNGPPDDTLLTSAASGELQSADGLSKAVDRMLAPVPVSKPGCALFLMTCWDLMTSIAWPRTPGFTRW